MRFSGTGFAIRCGSLCLAAWFASLAWGKPVHPHVVVVLADDLGYGDVQPLNVESTVATPAFAELASEAITFTDAHTPSAVCTPTRYGLLTGRYCWRTRLKRGVLNGYGKPLIEPDRATIASLLKDHGYRTHVVGKWHLGLGLHGGPDDLDLSKPLSTSPKDHGFDHSFVIPASLDFPPYVYFEDGRPTTTETVEQPAKSFPEFLRRGPRAKDFDMEGCLDRLCERATGVIAGMADAQQPQFLYFALTAPHKPVLPAERFRGRSELRDYGDFVIQVDDVVGRVLTAIKRAGVADSTLLVVTSDNGSFMFQVNESKPDHVDDPKVQGFHPSRHRSNGPWRGTKADIWEAGHRVPFFVRLPGGERGGSVTGGLVGVVDLFATIADFCGIEPQAEDAPDSHSFLALLQDPTHAWQRPPLVCHSVSGMFALREGPWKLVAGNGSGGREAPRGKPFSRPYALFDLAVDPGEANNVIDQEADRAARMEATLDQIRGDVSE